MIFVNTFKEKAMEVITGLFEHFNLVHVIAFLIVLAIGMAIGRKKGESGSNFWTTVFKDNKELDSTIKFVGILLLAFAMVHYFHDDVKTEAGIIIVSLFTCLTRSNSNGNGNGNH